MPKSLTSFAAATALTFAVAIAVPVAHAQAPQGPKTAPQAAAPQAPAPQGQTMDQMMGQMMGKGHARDDRSSRRERRRARRMEILDTNNDGKITLAEIEGELKRLAAAADVNGDGKISADEFRRRGRWFLRLRTVSFFDMLDANGDGQVSTVELTAPSGRWFARKDENKDKALSGEELNKDTGYHRRWRRRGRRR